MWLSKHFDLLIILEGPYRHVDNLGGLVETRYKDFRTVDKIFANTAATYPNNPCLGTRTMISEEDVKQPDGKVFKKVCLNNKHLININLQTKFVMI